MLTGVGLISYFLSNVPSEAYLVMLFPGLIILFGALLFQLKNKRLIYLAVLFIVSFNLVKLISSNYLTYDGVRLEKKIEASNKILKLAKGRKYNLIYKGTGEKFESSKMPYEYLTWWLEKNPPSESNEKKVIIIEELDDRINVSIGK